MQKKTRKQYTAEFKALLEEINAWFGPDLAKQQERDQHTDKLLSILQNQEDSIPLSGR